jgi:hypothetical protein
VLIYVACRVYSHDTTSQGTAFQDISLANKSYANVLTVPPNDWLGARLVAGWEALKAGLSLHSRVSDWLWSIPGVIKWCFGCHSRVSEWLHGPYTGCHQ